MRIALCVVGISLLAGCGKQGDPGNASDATPPALTIVASPTPVASPAPAQAKRLSIIATMAPMYSFTKNVAGDLADVEMAVPDGTNARDFKPAPADVEKIRAASLVVENGFGFEGWMDHIVEQGLGPGESRILAARGTGPGIPGLPGDPNTEPTAPTAPGDFDSGPPDPHVWLDPMMAIKEVQNIRDALMARDPANSDAYLANENAYESTLRDLDDEVGRDTVELTKRNLFSPNPAFNYFLKRYEFTVADKPNGADAVVLAPGDDAAKWNGARIIRLDPMESGTADPDFYTKKTLDNAAALREALK
jgi:zinc transport system substrate-binding protein